MYRANVNTLVASDALTCRDLVGLDLLGKHFLHVLWKLVELFPGEVICTCLLKGFFYIFIIEKLEPGFIDVINIGSLEGYRITQGVEGCGEYTYYFPITTEVTLVVVRYFITELNPITVDYEKFLNLPDVISPIKEEKLFNQILSTFQLLGEVTS